MESDHPPSIFIIWCIAHQALFKAPQREDLVGRRIVPKQAFRIAADILGQFRVARELSQERFGLDCRGCTNLHTVPVQPDTLNRKGLNGLLAE